MDGSSPRRRFRLAPTPSGALHLGNIFSFLLTKLYAASVGGEVLLRIDDLDTARSRPEFIAEIFRTLAALRIGWDLGPRNPQDFRERFSQGLSQAFYRASFEETRLRDPTRFYVCECSRSQVLRDHAGGVYGGRCRDRNLEWKPGRVWRCRTSTTSIMEWTDELLGQVKIDLADEMGDFIVFRKEGIFSYQWVSLCEDLKWGVTDIVRGEDLKTSTAAQLLLGRGTALERVRFSHHPLVLGGERKLSKSEGGFAVNRILADPGGAERIFRAFAKWCGLAGREGVASIAELQQAHSSGKGVLKFGRATQIDDFV